jgi:uncharacterized protein (DUF433 family)
MLGRAPDHDRISVRPGVMGGKPCIKGTRIPADLVLDNLDSGLSREDILDAYPGLTLEDASAPRRTTPGRCRGSCSMPWSPISIRSG